MPKFLHNSLNFYQQVSHSVFCRENNWQADSGIYSGDCSGFILTLLQQYRPSLLLELTKQYGHRPKAFQIYDWFKQPNTAITLKNTLADITPGDLILWRKLNPPKSGDTGHLAIVIEIGESQHRCLRIKVMDASKQAHDHDDRDRPGLACGWMSLTADDSGYVNGYIWSAELKKSKRTSIVIAHID